MRIGSSRCIGIAVLVVGIALSSARAEFALKDNDRVVLFGDMAFGEAFFIKWLDLYMRIGHPQLQAQVIVMSTDERGSDGNMVERLEEEVMPFEPTQVVLCFGLADPQRKKLSSARLEKYGADLEQVIEKLKASDAEVILLTPPVPEPERNRGLAALNYDEIIDAYAEKVREIAGTTGVTLLDWNRSIRDYSAALPSGVKRSTTLEGLAPSPLSIAICLDMLLAHWKAEPIVNSIELTWADPDPITVKHGAASLVSREGDTAVIRLERIPVPLHMPEKAGIPDAQWPMTKWCDYRLRIADLPDGGLAITDNDPKHAPLFVDAAAVREGADLTFAGPFFNHEVAEELRTYMMTKANQFRRFQRALDREAPQPELVEGYRLFAEAERAMAVGAMKVLQRLPTELSVELTLKLLDTASLEAARQTPQPKPKRPRPSRSAPKAQQPPSGE